MEDVLIDTRPPALLSASISPTQLRFGQTARISVTTDEVLQSPPTLHFQGESPVLTALPPVGTTYVFTVTPEEDEAAQTFVLEAISLIDLVGNDTLQATIDALPHALSGCHSTDALRRDDDAADLLDVEGFNVIEVSASLPEALPVGGVTATVGATLMDCAPLDEIVDDEAGTSYPWRCTAPVTDALADGPHSLLISAQDETENRDSAS